MLRKIHTMPSQLPLPVGSRTLADLPWVREPTGTYHILPTKPFDFQNHLQSKTNKKSNAWQTIGRLKPGNRKTI